ncbi:MAG: hypothetical protein WC341_03855, partial [Bacteroidales bacterium]
IRLQTEDTMTINICYSQLTEHENIYILKSTQSWHQALQTAKYSLTVVAPVSIDSISYLHDSISENVLFWDKSNFYPEKDFIVWIK